MSAGGFEIGCDGPSVLVVGVDGSDTSWRALYYAFGLARRQGSCVIAVFAVTTTVALDGTVVDSYETTVQMARELKAAAEGLGADFSVPAQFVCVAGDPVSALARIAETHHADALILGASQARGHRLFGSNAVRAVRRSRCPVTVVP